MSQESNTFNFRDSIDQFSAQLMQLVSNPRNVGFWRPEMVAHKAPQYEGIEDDVDKRMIKRILKGEYTYQRHYRKDKKYDKPKFIKINTHTIGHIQMDIADFRSISEFHKQPETVGIRQYALIFIDVFSRWLHVEPLYHNTKEEIFEGIQNFVRVWNDKFDIPQNWYETEESDEKADNNYKLKRIKSISCDREFARPAEYREFFNLNRIEHYSPQPGDKHGMVSLVERVIQTLRFFLGKIITFGGQYDWASYIHHVVDNYNDTYHSSLRTTPEWSVTHIDKFPPLTETDRKNVEK